MSLIAFILICYGMTQILTVGRVFNPIRPNYYFFKCSMCMGFWSSGIIYLSLYLFASISLFTVPIWLGVFFGACLGSGTSYFIQSLVSDHGFNIINNNANGGD
jgi:hypothetical protein